MARFLEAIPPSTAAQMIGDLCLMVTLGKISTTDATNRVLDIAYGTYRQGYLDTAWDYNRNAAAYQQKRS